MAELITKEKQQVVGVDVGDKHIDVCVLDNGGEVVEEARIRTKEEAIAGRFGMMAPAHVIMEAGTHSPWISRLLTKLGHEVVVANPARLRLIAESINKTDKNDAEVLARVGRLGLGLLTPVYHRTPQAQADLAIIRLRQELIQTRTTLVTAVRATVKSAGGRLPACDPDQFAKQVPAHVPEELRPAVLPLVAVIDVQTQQLKELDRQVEQVASERYPIVEFLREVKSVGPLTALAFVLVVEDPARFKTSRAIGPYFGMVPKRRDSGRRAPELGITKAGDRLVRAISVQCAQHLLGRRGSDCDLRRWGLARIGGSKAQKKRVIVAVARKLLVLLHRIWTTGERYDPFYQLHAQEAREAKLAAEAAA